MSMASLEKAILAELKIVAGKPKLKMKNIMEWSTGEIEVLETSGETLVRLPELGVNVAYKE